MRLTTALKRCKSLQETMIASLSNFRASLLDEFKQQLTNFSIPHTGESQPQIAAPGHTMIPQSDGSVRFGSLSAASPIMGTRSEGSSSTMARSEGTSPYIASTVSVFDIGSFDVLSKLDGEIITTNVAKKLDLKNKGVAHTKFMMTQGEHGSIQGVQGSLNDVQSSVGNVGMHDVLGSVGMSMTGDGYVNWLPGGGYGHMNMGLVGFANHNGVGVFASLIAMPQVNGSFAMSYSRPYLVSMINFDPIPPHSTYSIPNLPPLKQTVTNIVSSAPPTYATSTTVYAPSSSPHAVSNAFPFPNL
ncbi:hypothetical protein ACLB2K_007383 [Fragaria x ananassa]